MPKEEQEFDFESEMEIDPNALDVELLRQSSLFGRYATMEAESKRYRDVVWEELKVIRAELTKEANEVLDKPTATNVEAYYRDHQRHKDAKQKLIDAEFRVNMILVAISALHQRRYALDNLVRLCLAEYFAGPHVPRDLAGEYGKAKENRSERVQDKAKDRMSKKPARRRQTE